MKRHYLLFLTSLLSQTALSWGMDLEEKLGLNQPTIKHAQVYIEINTNATCSPVNPLGCDGALPRSLSEDLIIGQIQHPKANVIFYKERGEKILEHLKSYGLPSQKNEIIWDDFVKVLNAKSITLASHKSSFIACGLWRAHQEMSIQHQSGKTSLPLESMLSCLLTKEFSHKNKKISINEIQLIKNLVLANPYFRTLDLFNAGITDTHLKLMETIPHLEEFNLENSSEGGTNDITDKGISTLMNYPNLHKLNLAKNFNITPGGVALLAQSQTLKHLNLYKIQVGDGGAVHLSHNAILTYLDLREADIGDDGAAALANNKTLTDLRLRYNKITDNGAKAFIGCQHLTHLELMRNHVSQDLVSLLENLMPSNAYLNRLHDFKILPRSDLPYQKDRVRILSIDGGGIRGLLPGVVMKYVEDGLTKKIGSQFHFARHLDLIAGTSTGGIIGLGMVMPGERARPKYTMETLIDLYTTKGQEIFPPSWFGLPGIFEATYPEKPLEGYLNTYFGETCLSEALCPTLITSFDIKNNKSHTFDSLKANKKEDKNFLFKGAGRATSAAPTYYPSAKIKNEVGEEFELVDGGIYANNPTLLAIKRAQQLYPDAQEIVVYSFGTGEAIKKDLSYLGDKGLLNWGINIASILMHNAAELTEKLIKRELKTDPRIKYVRIQPHLEGSETKMDNVRPENIEHLLEAAEATIEKEKENLNAMIEEFYKDFETPQ